MPTYEYRCAKCSQHLEVYQSFTEDPLTKHKGCGGKLTKVLSAAGIVLKGSGFYKTDSRASNGARSKRRADDRASPDPASTGSPDSSSTSDSSNTSDSSRTEAKASGDKSTGSSSGTKTAEAKTA